MKQLMPADTLFITILRDPISLFESMYSYYSLSTFYKFNFSSFDDPNATLPSFNKRFSGRIGPNQMFFDLGYTYSRTPKRVLDTYIAQIESMFDLVMIEEYMDESLVFLKNLLCWTVEDVITFKINARSASRKMHIGPLGRQRIAKLNQADMRLYSHFRKSFENQMTLYKRRLLALEVAYLRERRSDWYHHCVQSEVLELDNQKKPKVIYFRKKNVNDINCKFMTTRELELTSFVREKQRSQYPGSVYELSPSEFKNFTNFNAKLAKLWK